MLTADDVARLVADATAVLPTCLDNRFRVLAETTEALRANLAACQERAARAERERDMWREELGRAPTGERQAQRLEELIALRGDLAAARGERDKLQAFKDWVHSYLDAHHVPHHPPGPHGAEGCRIGDRLDWLFAERDAARGERGRLRDLLAEIAGRLENDPFTYAQGCLMAKRIRAALEKSNA